MAIDSMPTDPQLRDWFYELSTLVCQDCNVDINWINCDEFCPCTLALHACIAVKPTMVWVTAYEITRVFGGLEEGGWWYDCGEPRASIPCLSNEQVVEAIQRLKNIYCDVYVNRRTRYSAIGEEDLSIVVEHEQGHAWPLDAPCYE